MSIEGVTAKIASKAATIKPFGKKIKFSLDGQVIHLDGTTTPPTVCNDDLPSDATIVVSLEIFTKIVDKSMHPQTAFLSGKIKIKGNVMAAMALNGIF